MMKSRPFPGNITRASRCPLFDFGCVVAGVGIDLRGLALIPLIRWEHANSGDRLI
jgi:hypothetical protein